MDAAGIYRNEPQPTWVGVEMEKNNATLFNGLPIGFRACAGDEDWMHTCYSAGWWSSTAGVQMGPEFGITVVYGQTSTHL